MENAQLEYAGFWVRFGAVLIDTALFLLITSPLLYWVYGQSYWGSGEFIAGGWDLALNWCFPCIATIVFWIYRSATPGKMALKLQVVDAVTGQPLSTKSSIIRYIAYYLSTLPLCLGFIWVVFNRKKQGWHDLIAHSVVVRPVNRGVKDVSFKTP